ncbi:MAG: hypothetical protein QHJ73_07520, partial [Armatimonadota bacterium]|nr:hypothetical protein [Armatimonadota bacterium]
MREETRGKVMEILTAEQKATLEKWERENPAPQRPALRAAPSLCWRRPRYRARRILRLLAKTYRWKRAVTFSPPVAADVAQEKEAR